MVSRRALLRALGLSAAAGLAGCNAFDNDNADGTVTRTRTATATVTQTATPTTTLPPTTDVGPTTTTATPTATGTPSSTVAGAVGTSAFTHTPGSGIDEFGRAVALSAEAAVVVAESHGAYVFEVDGDWSRTTVLTPDDGEDFGGHNVSAALVGDEAVVGGPSAGSEGGAVYLFERLDGQWRQRHQFIPDEGRNEFGRAVAFDGDRVVVGDANDPTPEVSWIGRAYVFQRDGSNWTQEATLGTDAQNLFGTSVAVDGHTVLIGAPYAEPDDERTGAVYGYELTDGEWQRRTALTPDDTVADSLFGQSVAIDGDTAVVGAPSSGGGSAYVFERTDDGWTRQARITAPDEDSEDGFGQSVASTGGIAVVGAPKAARTGQAYVFRADGNWTETRRLVAGDPNEDTEFGFAVALFDATALVGSPAVREASPAYLFDL